MSAFIASISYGLSCLLSQVLNLSVNASMNARFGENSTTMVFLIILRIELSSLNAHILVDLARCTIFNIMAWVILIC